MTQGTADVTNQLLAMIEAWRDRLGKNIALRNPTFTREDLNTAVHRIISRIIFLRVCEERGIERKGTLGGLLEGEGAFRRLSDHFPGHGDREDSGPPDSLAPDLIIDEKVLEGIREQLDLPGAPLEYSAVTPAILCQVYDRFLGKSLRLRGGRHARVEENPEVKAGGGIHDVPQFAVDYVVGHTLGELVEGKTPDGVSMVRILDPACGSGSFLVAACRFLFDWHLDWYIGNLVPVLEGTGSATAPGVQVLIPRPPLDGTGREGAPRDLPICRAPVGGEPCSAPAWTLTMEERGRILLNAIYSVDIDRRAVEVTQLSLLLMVLGADDAGVAPKATAPLRDRVIRGLHRNIRCGNSLVGPDYFRQKQVAPYNFGEQKRINPFDWNTGFAGIMDSGGFDAVIGNPPSAPGRSPKGVEEYFQTHYQAYHGEADLSGYFMEKGLSLLRPGGIFAAIVANRWLRANSGTPLRKWLKEQQIEGIVDFGDLPVFRNSTTYPCILRVRNLPRSHEFLVSKPDTISFPSLDEYIREHHHRADPKHLTGGWRLDDPRTVSLSKKIGERGTPLGDYVMGQMYHGTKTGHERFLRREPGIVCPELCQKPEFIYDESGSYTRKTGVIIPRADKYLLGILNSRLTHFLFVTSLPGLQQGLFMPAYVVLKNIPIYVPDFDEPADVGRHNRMVALVTHVLDLSKRLRETTLEHEKKVIQRHIEATDQEIDDLVYELYGLTGEERRIVEGATGGGKRGT